MLSSICRFPLLALVALFSVDSHLSAQKQDDSETLFLHPDEVRRALRKNYVPDATPGATPVREKNPTIGVEERIQINALFSAAEAFRAQGNGLDAAAYYQQAAAKGDTISLLRLADLYSGYADGVIPDPSKSEKYLRTAAARDNRQALIRLAEIHRDGIGCQASPEMAASFYRQAMKPHTPRDPQSEVAAAAALIKANRKIDDQDFKRILMLVRAEGAGSPADRATILFTAIAMVQNENGRQSLIPKKAEETDKNTTSSFSLPDLLRELLADQTLTIESAVAEVDQVSPDHPNLPTLQHRAALLLVSPLNPSEGARERADTLFKSAAATRHLPSIFRVHRPKAKDLIGTHPSANEVARARQLFQDKLLSEEEVLKMPYLLIEAAAEAGDPDAQYELGQACLQELGRQKNSARAFQAFQKSSRGGNTAAIYRLGRCYARGIGTSIDRSQATYLIGLAAAKGHPEGMYELAKALENGRGIDKDPATAATWLTKAANAGAAEANIELAQKALNPETERIDIPTAARYYLAAAQADNAAAQVEFLKIVFVPNSRDNASPARFYGASGEQIFKWCQSLATNKTLTEKQRRLCSYFQARCLADGIGTTRDIVRASKVFASLSGASIPKTEAKQTYLPISTAGAKPPLDKIQEVQAIPTPASP